MTKKIVVKIVGLIMGLLIGGMIMSATAQTSVKETRYTVNADGDYVAKSRGNRAKDEEKPTGHYYIDSKGNKHEVYEGAKGGKYYYTETGSKSKTPGTKVKRYLK